MNLIYSIPNKIYYIQNFLDYNSYKQLHKSVFKDPLSLKKASETWDSGLLHGMKKSPDRIDLDPSYIVLKKLNILLNTNPFCKINKKEIEFVLHSMKDGAGINWHDDGNYKFGITYYINRRWNLLFGGEFLFTSETQNGFIPLVGNSLVIVKPPLVHKVASVMKPLVPRKTIQIFIS